MRRRVAQVVTAVVGTLTLVGTLAGTAAASADENASAPGPIERYVDLDDADPEPWEPYREDDFSLPAGEYCPFAVRGHIAEDEELVRVASRYDDRAVRVLEYKGQLIIEFTNVDSGETVRRNLSGRAWLELRPDGSVDVFAGVGPFGGAFSTADNYPAGQYVLRGIHVITWDDAGRRSMPVDRGSEEDLCDTLS